MCVGRKDGEEQLAAAGAASRAAITPLRGCKPCNLAARGALRRLTVTQSTEGLSRGLEVPSASKMRWMPPCSSTHMSITCSGETGGGAHSTHRRPRQADKQAEHRVGGRSRDGGEY